jgi:hypothetical protein
MRNVAWNSAKALQVLSKKKFFFWRSFFHKKLKTMNVKIRKREREKVRKIDGKAKANQIKMRWYAWFFVFFLKITHSAVVADRSCFLRRLIDNLPTELRLVIFKVVPPPLPPGSDLSPKYKTSFFLLQLLAFFKLFDLVRRFHILLFSCLQMTCFFFYYLYCIHFCFFIKFIILFCLFYFFFFGLEFW